MTITQDVLSGTTCELRVPGVQRWGPGWYLVATNERVECGPFADRLAAVDAADWLDDMGHGVHPGPWEPRWSGVGLLVGSRVRDRRAETSSAEPLAV